MNHLTTIALLCLAAVVLALPATAPAQADNVTIDFGSKHQRIEGFGSCLVSWVGEMQKVYRTEKFQRIYAGDMGCSMTRGKLPDKLWLYRTTGETPMRNVGNLPAGAAMNVPLPARSISTVSTIGVQPPK